MNLELNISSTLQAKLKRLEASTGKSVNALIVEAVEERFALAKQEEAMPLNMGHSEWVEALRDWSNSHPTGLDHVGDSRDGIYESR